MDVPTRHSETVSSVITDEGSLLDELIGETRKNREVLVEIRSALQDLIEIAGSR